MQLIKQFSLGKLPLWKSFWILGVLGQFTFFFLVSLVLHALNGYDILQQTVAVFAFAMGVFIWIGEWRCAFNTRYKFLGALLRVWLVISALAVASKFLPHLPEAARVILIGLIALGILATTGYYLFTLIRDFVRHQNFKRQNSGK